MKREPNLIQSKQRFNRSHHSLTRKKFNEMKIEDIEEIVARYIVIDKNNSSDASDELIEAIENLLMDKKIS